MNKFERYFFALLGLVIVILLVWVISMMNNPAPGYTDYMPGYNQPGGMMGQGGIRDPDTVYPYEEPGNNAQFDSNGEMIYYTGYNESGQRIPFSYGPNWLYVHGGSCVNCHGVNGEGGVPIMMAYELPADIRYDSLTSEEHEAEEGEEHPPYTDETIKRAIREGVDPTGEELDPVMPRWHMTEGDLNDTVDYLKQL
ncbi:MAG: cytochrome c, mono- and diheme variants family [Methanolobus sp. T82-4]|nr:cytochrome c [Methanolobus zinderi]KXS44172.1 MAG: cytochrome c, mono- and diheme variants family [Methanolobus sp. T82-4]